jgi:hypothetical protein
MQLDYIDTVERLREVTTEIVERKSRWYKRTSPDSLEWFLHLCMSLNGISGWQMLGRGMAKDIWMKYFANDPDAANFILATTNEISQRSFACAGAKESFVETFTWNIVSINDTKTAIPRESLAMIPTPEVAKDTLNANIWLLPIFIFQMLEWNVIQTK